MKSTPRYVAPLKLVAIVVLYSAVMAAETKKCPPLSSPYLTQITAGPGIEVGPALSHDGRRVAFEYTNPTPPDRDQIWVMDLAEGFKSARPLVKDENYNSWPNWSPDGQWISFISGRRITKGDTLTYQVYKVRVSDGAIIQLTHFPNETALRDSTSWSGDRIAFVYDDGIYAVSDSGGEPEELVDLTQRLSPGSLWGAVWSPDGSRLAFRGIPPGSGEADKRIWVADSKGKQVIQVTKDFTDDLPSWLDNDHILFERWGSAGEVRICIVCLRTLRVAYLTRGHIDQTPAADRTGHTLFFARAKLSEENIRAWLPQTHIWAVPINRGRVEHP